MNQQPLYAVYRGIRYEARKISSRKYCLSACGPECPEGFLALGRDSHTYYKNVLRSELEALFLLENIAVYQNHRLPVREMGAGWVLLHTEDATAAAAVQMEADESGWEKRVPVNELTRLIEYRTFLG